MKLIQKVRGTLSLISIQSTPVTVVSLLLGYSAITGTIVTRHVFDLILVGALGHWGFYSLNDLLDLEWDKSQERVNKPLVRGDITEDIAWSICGGLIALALIRAFVTFPLYAFLFWIAACILGALYNSRSKTDRYSAIYMALWGATIIYTGALYADDGFNYLVVILSALLGGHMLWMTIMGDLKDVGQGEDSIPESLDCKVINDDGYKHLWTSIRFNLLSMSIMLAQIIMLLLVPIGDGLSPSDIPFIYFAIAGSVAIWICFQNVLYQPGFREDVMKKDIALFEIVSVISILIVSVSFIELPSAVLLFAISIVWGLAWQTVLYGHPLRFP